MLCRELLLVLLSSLVQQGSSQESGCAAAAPALLQADQRRVHRNLTEEANSSHASKAGNVSKNQSISQEEKKEEAEEKKEEAEDDKEEEKEEKEEANSSHVSKASNISKNQNISYKKAVEEKEEKKEEAEEKKEEVEDNKEEAKLEAEEAAEKKNESKTTGPPTMPSYADIDMNKDGVLTPKEFQTKRAKVVAEIEKEVKTVKKHEKQIEDSKLSLERNIDEMPAYEDLDRNTDGVVTPAEYRTSSDTAMAKNLSYKALDGNNDGAVTPGDFKNASEKWAAELTMQVEEKIKELASEREHRRKLEQEIDNMESYEDLDKQRDGVITRSEYGQEAKSSHGTWSVGSHVAATKQVQKAGSTTTSVGFACLAVLAQAL